MTLKNGIYPDVEKTFGELKFQALVRENFEENEDGTRSERVKSRTYKLKSRGQKKTVQVTLPPKIALKECKPNAVVELVNATVGSVAEATFNGANATWYVGADDLILKKADVSTIHSKEKRANNQV